MKKEKKMITNKKPNGVAQVSTQKSFASRAQTLNYIISPFNTDLQQGKKCNSSISSNLVHWSTIIY